MSKRPNQDCFDDNDYKIQNLLETSNATCQRSLTYATRRAKNDLRVAQKKSSSQHSFCKNSVVAKQSDLKPKTS